LGAARILLWKFLFNDYGEHYMVVVFTVALSVLGVVAWGCLAGSVLPLILRRFNLDPATASAPFIATLVDVTGVLIYFNVARIIMAGTFL